MPSISALSEAHLPTLEEILHRNPFDLVDSPWGKIEAWRASTMATGTMGALAQVAIVSTSQCPSGPRSRLCELAIGPDGSVVDSSSVYGHNQEIS